MSKIFPTGMTTKASPILADKLLLGDSADTNKAKVSTVEEVFNATHEGGSFYISTPITNTANGTPAKLSGAGATTEVQTNNFTHTSPNRLTYNGTGTRTFTVLATLSCTHSTTNTNLSFYIAKNDSVITGSQIDRKVGTGGDVGAVAIVYEVELTTNDYIEIFTDADSAGTTTISLGSVIVTQ